MSSAGSGQPVGGVWTYTGGPGIKNPDYRRSLRTTSLSLRRDSSQKARGAVLSSVLPAASFIALWEAKALASGRSSRDRDGAAAQEIPCTFLQRTGTRRCSADYGQGEAGIDLTHGAAAARGADAEKHNQR